MVRNGIHPVSLLPFVLGLVFSRDAGAENLLANGDFESVRESGWTYTGHDDGSHGVFSEPSRPGTRVYLLQVLDAKAGAFSSISQRVRVLPGRNYRIRLEFLDSCNRQEDWPDDFVTATIGGDTVFLHPLAGADGSGWNQREAIFQASSAETDLVIRLQGSLISREDSTVAIDQVELFEAPETEIKPFRPGYPLVPVTRRVTLPFGLAFDPPTDQLAGYEPLERFRKQTGHTPAYLAWNLSWDPVTAPQQRFAEIRPHLEPWARSGIIPILTVQGPAPLDVPEDVLETYLRAWGQELASWGYPVLLRPWPGMERQHPSGSARRFTDFWRKARGWFATEGAENVFWFWTPAALSSESDPFYPGDAHVDFVGCPEGPSSLKTIYEHFQLHYRRKALAIPETTTPDTLSTIDELSALLVKQYPRIEFYTHSIDRRFLMSASPPAFASNPAWQGKSSLVQFRLVQQSPPRAMATLSRDGDNVRAVITNISEEGAPAGSDFIVEFYSGDPEDGGVRVGSSRFLRLGRGREKTFQQTYRPGDPGVPHLRIAAKPGPGTSKSTANPPEEVRVFRLVP